MESIQCFLCLNISSYSSCSINVATAEVNIQENLNLNEEAKYYYRSERKIWNNVQSLKNGRVV